MIKLISSKNCKFEINDTNISNDECDEYVCNLEGINDFDDAIHEIDSVDIRVQLDILYITIYKTVLNSICL